MKIFRLKKFKKIIQYYKINFQFREPFQILIDATFCYAALKNKVNIKEQLENLFETELKLLTTQCIIMEIEKLGPKLLKVAAIMKRFGIHKCGHKESISGGECFKQMVKVNRYFIATQDRELQEWIRRQSGQPLIYLHQVTPVLEPPSEQSKKQSDHQMETKVDVNEHEAKRILILKSREGLVKEEKPKKKRKKVKQPNPLSCKKKKVKVIQNNDRKSDAAATGKNNKKGKKVKISRHLKEHLKVLKLVGKDAS